MNARRAMTALGAGPTTLLVVGGLVTALLPVEFSALVGLPVGAIVGLLVVLLALGAPIRPDTPVGRAASAYATAGCVILALAGLSCANPAGARGTFAVSQWLAVAAVAAIVVYVGLWVRAGGTAA